MRLHLFTRKLAECRKRWNQGSLRYVLEAARILRGARIAARTNGRWGRWVEEETSMSRITAYRYMKVELLISANVSRLKQIENLGLSKIFALLTLKREDLLTILSNRRLLGLSDIQFRAFVRQFKPKLAPRTSTPNLARALDAALRRLDAAVLRWRSCRQPIPPEIRVQLLTKLRKLIRETSQESRMAV